MRLPSTTTFSGVGTQRLRNKRLSCKDIGEQKMCTKEKNTHEEAKGKWYKKLWNLQWATHCMV